jgi:transcriptional regulator with XRE-family HTH domain
MEETDVAARIAQLRIQKGVSARDMSLSLGQNPGYINNIETGKTRPSLSGILYICEYFGITPSEFFDLSAEAPQELAQAIQLLKKLNRKHLSHICSIIQDILER